MFLMLRNKDYEVVGIPAESFNSMYAVVALNNANSICIK